MLESRGMRPRHAVTAAAAAALLLAGCAEPRPEKRWSALPDDAGIRMFAYASEFVKTSPRDAGSPGAARASRWIAQELKRMGLRPEADCWTENTAHGRKTFCNVYVDFPGASGQTVLLAGHYDTKSGIPGFLGANDSASGVAVLLELARALAAHPLPGTEIRLACLDGEECAVQYGPRDGLHGSRRWAADLEASGDLPRIRAFILLDMVGDADLTPTLPRNCAPALLHLAFEAARAEGIRNRVSLFPGPVLDDHVPFHDRGVPALDLIDFQYGSAPGLNDYWHTPADTPDKLSAASLALAARLALRIAFSLP